MPVDLRPELDPTHLAVSRWPVDWRPDPVPSGFCALVVDTDEVTLVCSEAQLAQYPPAEAEVGWRRVTFAGPLPWEQVGFLADVAGRLANAQIPFTSLSGFTTDHVLVRAAQADLAVSVLRGEEPPEPRPGTTNP
ncbi:MAG: ACT domain-containing protein [Actinobacteria bacterium]|nr:ACT domain-containing protein [Actinomycetota bacterium]MCA1721843.1 ACT domain-containing protein [Actinomycetota bacterium]